MRAGTTTTIKNTDDLTNLNRKQRNPRDLWTTLSESPKLKPLLSSAGILGAGSFFLIIFLHYLNSFSKTNPTSQELAIFTEKALSKYINLYPGFLDESKALTLSDTHTKQKNLGLFKKGENTEDNTRRTTDITPGDYDGNLGLATKIFTVSCGDVGQYLQVWSFGTIPNVEIKAQMFNADGSTFGPEHSVISNLDGQLGSVAVSDSAAKNYAIGIHQYIDGTAVNDARVFIFENNALSANYVQHKETLGDQGGSELVRIDDTTVAALSYTSEPGPYRSQLDLLRDGMPTNQTIDGFSELPGSTTDGKADFRLVQSKPGLSLITINSGEFYVQDLFLPNATAKTFEYDGAAYKIDGTAGKVNPDLHALSGADDNIYISAQNLDDDNTGVIDLYLYSGKSEAHTLQLPTDLVFTNQAALSAKPLGLTIEKITQGDLILYNAAGGTRRDAAALILDPTGKILAGPTTIFHSAIHDFSNFEAAVITEDGKEKIIFSAIRTNPDGSGAIGVTEKITVTENNPDNTKTSDLTWLIPTILVPSLLSICVGGLLIACCFIACVAIAATAIFVFGKLAKKDPALTINTDLIRKIGEIEEKQIELENQNENKEKKVKIAGVSVPESYDQRRAVITENSQKGGGSGKDATFRQAEMSNGQATNSPVGILVLKIPAAQEEKELHIKKIERLIKILIKLRPYSDPGSEKNYFPRFEGVCLMDGKQNKIGIITNYGGKQLTHFHANRKGKLTSQEAINYIEKLFDAYAILHEEGIVHRDVSDVNIVTNRKEITVIDFLDSSLAANSKKTRTGDKFEGSPGFQPPETFGDTKGTLRDGHKIPFTYKLDVFGVSIIAWCFLLTDGEINEAYKNIPEKYLGENKELNYLKEEFCNIDPQVPDIPSKQKLKLLLLLKSLHPEVELPKACDIYSKEIQEILLKCLEQEPENRPAMKEVLKVIKQVKKTLHKKQNESEEEEDGGARIEMSF